MTLGGVISNYILGVDPGLSGGLAILDSDTQNIVASTIMPTAIIGTHKEVDSYKLSKFIEPYCAHVSFAVLEDVFSMTGQGVASMFSFGVTKGSILGVLAAFNITIIRAVPSIWKINMGLSSDKTLSFGLATKLFPLQANLWKLKKQDGVAEAVLLAKWGERFL